MKSRETELRYLILGFDLLLLNIAIALIAWFDLGISHGDYKSMSFYFLDANLAWLITFFIFSKQNLFLNLNFFTRLVRITKRHLLFYFVTLSISFLKFQGNLPGYYFFEYFVLFYVFEVHVYWLIHRYFRFKRSKKINTLPALVIGYNETGRLLKRIIKSNPILGYKFVGYICAKRSYDKIILGNLEALEELIDKHQIQIVFHTVSFFSDDKMEKIGKDVMKLCNRKGVRVRFVPKNQRFFRSRFKENSIGGLTVLNLQEIPLDDVRLRVQKRAFDIVFSSLVILFVYSWFFPLMALIIKLDSKGPLFFVQPRTGINNRTFNCLKFRSMVVNTEANKKQATANDKRITKVGNFMRNSSVDELPQFINVFLGNMSVVGPRPHMLAHTDQYSALIDNYLVRHYVKPGITGLAQVKGYRGETSKLSCMEKRVNADMEYLENWTFWGDIQIVWQTVFGRSEDEVTNSETVLIPQNTNEIKISTVQEKCESTLAS